MASSETASLVRRLLQDEMKLLPGKNYNRVAPAHVFNKFLYKLFGSRGDAHQNLIDLAAGNLDQELMNDIVEMSSDVNVQESLSLTTSAIFNADRRAFPTRASFFPIDGRAIGEDSSDDNYGFALLELLTNEQKKLLRHAFQVAVDSSSSIDVISSTATLLTRRLGEQSHPPANEAVNEDEQESVFGSVVFRLLSNALEFESFKPTSPYRLKNLQHVSSMLTGLTALGLLMDPITRASRTDLSENSDLSMGKALGILVFTGVPAGPPRDICVKLAQASLDDAVLRAYRCIEDIFVEVMGGESWGGATEWVESVVLSRRLSGDSALKMMRVLSPFITQSTPRNAFSALLSVDELRSAVRALGVKVGLAGPQRGSGDVRLLFETSFLESLVYFLGRDGMSFDEFVDSCYSELGLVVGRVSNLDAPVLERLNAIADRYVDVEEVFDLIHSMLQKRLVSSGLAQEYSDGFTVIRRA